MTCLLDLTTKIYGTWTLSALTVLAKYVYNLRNNLSLSATGWDNLFFLRPFSAMSRCMKKTCQIRLADINCDNTWRVGSNEEW